MLLIKKEFLEQSILATMLEENYLIMDSQLKPEMFYGQHHRQLFMLMQLLVKEGHPVDYLTLSARFEQVETIGVSYLTELMMFANTEKFDDYAQLLREIWRERQKAQILFQASEGDWAIPQIIERLDNTQLEGNQVDTSITQNLVAMHNRPWEDVDTPGLIVPPHQGSRLHNRRVSTRRIDNYCSQTFNGKNRCHEQYSSPSWLARTFTDHLFLGNE